MTLKSGQRSLKVIETDTDRSATYDFLLTFHSNHGPICTVSEINGDFSRKLRKFSHRCVFCPPPADGVTLESLNRRRGPNDGATRWSKKF